MLALNCSERWSVETARFVSSVCKCNYVISMPEGRDCVKKKNYFLKWASLTIITFTICENIFFPKRQFRFGPFKVLMKFFYTLHI